MNQAWFRETSASVGIARWAAASLRRRARLNQGTTLKRSPIELPSPESRACGHFAKRGGRADLGSLLRAPKRNRDSQETRRPEVLYVCRSRSGNSFWAPCRLSTSLPLNRRKLCPGAGIVKIICVRRIHAAATPARARHSWVAWGSKNRYRRQHDCAEAT